MALAPRCGSAERFEHGDRFAQRSAADTQAFGQFALAGESRAGGVLSVENAALQGLGSDVGNTRYFV